jgi:predicted kinase
MNNILTLNKLYVLSGVSGSGKTYFLNKLIDGGLPKESIVSINDLLSNILGIPKVVNEFNKIKKNGFNNIVKEILDIRLSQNLTTFIDDVNLTEEVRKMYFDLAKKHGMDTEILIFNNELNILNERKNVNENEFREQLNKFKKDSSIKYRYINHNDYYKVLPELLTTNKLDVIGDVHGLLNELIDFLSKNNWQYKGGFFEPLDKERRLLFLGDILDRGTQSVELLKVVKNTCEKGYAKLLIGNHEEKLISAYDKFKQENVILYKSLSAFQTFTEFLKLKDDEREELFKFLQSCSVKATIWIDKKTQKATQINEDDIFKIGFCHANNVMFDESFMPRSLALYGTREKNSDRIYDENYVKKINSHILFRGHVLNHGDQDFVCSLEDDQAFEGNLVLIKLDEYIKSVKENNWEPNYFCFEENMLKYKSEFNFDKYIKGKIMLLKEMNNLVENGLATDGWRKDESGKKQPHEDGFKVFKYSKAVHFKRLWKSNPWLEKARGLVLDQAGNIVVHPFDKLYNFGEYDVGQNVSKDKKVQVIEKVNGYLGCISKHPFKNELVLSTTGSIAKDAPYVQMIGDFINPELNGRLLNFFNKNNMTLMFEVVHPKDPHIIEYSEKDYGLWLIGARKKDLDAKTETEPYLDNISKTLGFKRPAWEEKTFGEVLESLQTSQLEGFMIRDGDNNDPMMKIKTNYYLVTKFVGRMGKNMVKMMFNHSEQFKEQKVDEEFYPIVDKIISKISENDFNEMPQGERVLFVREIVNETRNEFLSEDKTISTTRKLNFK